MAWNVLSVKSISKIHILFSLLPTQKKLSAHKKYAEKHVHYRDNIALCDTDIIFFLVFVTCHPFEK